MPAGCQPAGYQGTTARLSAKPRAVKPRGSMFSSPHTEMIKTIRWFLFFCCLVAPFSAGPVPCGAGETQELAPAVARKTGNPSVSPVRVPEPTLLEPAARVVDISDKLFVAFRWEPKGSPYQVWYYMFRLYRGHETAAVRQIYAKQVSALTPAVAISIDYFRDGESYTWSVVQVDAGPLFSEPAFATFRVVKK
ncbi:hypothetical protein BU251_06950 [Candidatus Velamenicoccus archaeovorus]|uniref:Uncharacterized protein n=2 Tax=Velamenicoccus archaeovorus TaxID=1930593 RepID=A0A410P5L4_VELA1|nr:hypothetical protein BU251_06950 [Candidatus Velamenicoccus archaeovorus]